MKLFFIVLFFAGLVFSQVDASRSLKIERTKTGEIKRESVSQTGRRVETKSVASKSVAKASEGSKLQASLIVALPSVPLRKEAKMGAPVLDRLKLGETLHLIEKTPRWYKIERLSNGEKGWVNVESVEVFKKDSLEKVFLKVANKNYKTEMKFEEALELMDFLSDAESSAKTAEVRAELEFLRLLSLRQAASFIVSEQQQKRQHKDFLKRYQSFLAYDESLSRWIVSSKFFWKLSEKYKQLPIAEKIAWEAAQNPVIGDCKEYIVCHLYRLRVTKAEYLRIYPNGDRAKDALKGIGETLESMIASGSEFRKPADITDKAEFFNLIAELRTIVSKVAFIEKEKVLRQLKQLADSL